MVYYLSHTLSNHLDRLPQVSLAYIRVTVLCFSMALTTLSPAEGQPGNPEPHSTHLEIFLEKQLRAEEYSRIRSLGKAAIPILVSRLSPEHQSDIRRHSAIALIKFGKEAVPYLIATLEGSSQGGRRYAAGILGMLGDPSARSALVRAANDPDREVQRAAKGALGLLGKPSVDELLGMLTNPNSKLREYAANGLISSWSAAVPLLIEKMSSRNAAWFQGMISQIIDRFGADAISLVIEALEKGSSRARMNAAGILGEHEHPERVAVLVQALYDEDRRVRGAAAEAILKIGEEAVPVLLSKASSLSWGDRASLLSILNEMDWSTATGQQTIEYFIIKRDQEQLLNVGFAAMKALTGRLADDHDRDFAASILIKYGEPALDLLVEMQKTSQGETRRITAAALGKIGHPAAVPSLMLAVNAEDALLTATAREALIDVQRAQTSRTARLQNDAKSLYTDHPDLDTRSNIARHEDRWLLYVDRQQFSQNFGAIYQPVPSREHINEYNRRLGSLHSALLDEEEGGLGHARRLRQMGIYIIRVYELTTDDPSDIQSIKAIFRRVFEQYGIRVLAGHYAGLYDDRDFSVETQREAVLADIRLMAETYIDEPWLLGWQIGNENNYYLPGGKPGGLPEDVFGERINLSAEAYYNFMDTAAGIVRNVSSRLNRHHIIVLGNGDLTKGEAQWIRQMKNIDALGMNVYRDRHGVVDLFHLAEEELHIPLIISEFGIPAESVAEQALQSQYFKELIPYINTNMEMRGRRCQVLLAFFAEATDQRWKSVDLGELEQGFLGVFGKSAEQRIAMSLQEIARKKSFPTLPSFDSRELLSYSWRALEEFQYDQALAFSEAVVRMYWELARQQQNLAEQEGKPPREKGRIEKQWALNNVGEVLLIQIRSFHETGSRLRAVRAYEELTQYYGHSLLRDADGTYRSVPYCVRKLFPDLLPAVIFKTQASRVAASFVVALLVTRRFFVTVILRWKRRRQREDPSAEPSVVAYSVMNSWERVIFFTLILAHGYMLFTFARWWFHPIRMDHYLVNVYLYWTLGILGCFFLTYNYFIWYVIWNMRRPRLLSSTPGCRVAMVTTHVADEPLELAKGTLRKMKEVTYRHDTYILDEAGDPVLGQCCQDLGVTYFSRKGLSKYQQDIPPFQRKTKAGNLNAWIDTFGENYDFVTFLDLDHQPCPQYLDRVLGFFRDEKVGFVQAPNHFDNSEESWVARGSIEPNGFLIGPIQMGMYGNGCTLVNGSHSTFRLEALRDIELYAVHNADDILTGIRLHANGWKDVYVPEILAEGQMPAAWRPALKQQYRWAHSMFDILMFHYFKYRKKLSWTQAGCYAGVAAFYGHQVAFCILLCVPVLSVLRNQSPVNLGLGDFLLRFLPVYLMPVLILILWGQRFLLSPSQKRGFWWRAGLVEIASSPYVFSALIKAAFRKKLVRTEFVTPKGQQERRSSLNLFYPHLFIMGVATFALLYSLFLGQAGWQTEGMRLFLIMEILLMGLLALSATEWFQDRFE